MHDFGGAEKVSWELLTVDVGCEWGSAVYEVQISGLGNWVGIYVIVRDENSLLRVDLNTIA